MSRNVPVCSKNAAAPFDRECLGYVDLDVADVGAIPYRLVEAVGEAQGQDVVDRLLAEEVIDAKDVGLVETLGDCGVQLAAEARSVPKGFSQMILVFTLSPVAPSISMMPSNALGGTAR